MSMRLPKLWSQNSSLVGTTTQSHLEKYKHLIKWKKNESILEAGFASGQNSQKSLRPILPEDYKEFVAIDVSAEMVEYAKEHVDMPRFHITQLDLASPVIPADFQNRFDHVFSFYTMHMIKNTRQAWKNIYDMLKPGGTAFINYFKYTPTDDVFDTLHKHPKWGKYGQDEMISAYYYAENPKEEYKKDIEAAGFTDYIFNSEKHVDAYPSSEERDALHIAVNSVLPRIPPEELEEYKKYYLELLDKSEMAGKITYENNKKIVTLDYTMYVIIATKT